MIKSFKASLSKSLLIARRLINMVVTEIPIEFRLILMSYLIYLCTKQSEWLYYGIPMVCILHCLNGTKYYYGSPFIHIIFLICAFYTNFPNTLLYTSLLTALTCLCLNNKKRIAMRIYQLSKHLFIAFYCIAFIILAMVFLYITASIILTIPEQLKDTLSQVCIFIFSVILPTLFLATDKHRKQEEVTIPKSLRWVQLIIIETLIQIGTIYLGVYILQMALRSLLPRPYVVYIVIAVIIAIEISAKLHDWSPKNWNDLFFTHRNLLYIPLIFLGIAALYIEFLIVGYRPRTLAASILLGWITIICIARLVRLSHITTKERLLSLYTSIILTIIICISTVIY